MASPQRLAAGVLTDLHTGGLQAGGQLPIVGVESRRWNAGCARTRSPSVCAATSITRFPPSVCMRENKFACRTPCTSNPCGTCGLPLIGPVREADYLVRPATRILSPPLRRAHSCVPHISYRPIRGSSTVAGAIPVRTEWARISQSRSRLEQTAPDTSTCSLVGPQLLDTRPIAVLNRRVPRAARI